VHKSRLSRGRATRAAHPRRGLGQAHGGLVPARALQEQPVHDDALAGPRGALRRARADRPSGRRGRQRDHLKVDRVDGHTRAAGKVLQRRRQKGLREEEARQPELGGRAALEPVLRARGRGRRSVCGGPEADQAAQVGGAACATQPYAASAAESDP